MAINREQAIQEKLNMTLPDTTLIESVLALLGLEDLPRSNVLILDLVPPAGVEPALPKEPHFECGASTSSTREATYGDYLAKNIKSMPGAGKPQSVFSVRARAVTHKISPVDNMRILVPHTLGRTYLQIHAVGGKCNVTGKTLEGGWKGRKWYLSEHMTDSEIVMTAFKALLTAVEHELREKFKYRGVTIFDPHTDVEQLVAMRSNPDSLSHRKPVV